MRIDSSNKEVLRKVNLHDGLFAGFTYDYKARQLRMICENGITGKLHKLVFNNVISSILQSCEFYYPSNTITGHSVEKCSPTLDKLNSEIPELQELNYKSQLDKEIEFIVIDFELISGDTLEIICESVDHTEIELKE